MNPTITVSLIAALLVAGVGCATVNTVNTVEPAQQAASREYIQDHRVVTDKSLNRRIRILGVNTATGPEGYMKIQLGVKNATTRRHAFTYKVEWFDENGMVINLPTGGSTPRSLEGGETIYINAVAPNAMAKDFVIKMIEPVH